MKIMFTFGNFSSIDECSMFTEQFFSAVCCSLARALALLSSRQSDLQTFAREKKTKKHYIFFLYFSNIGYFQVVEKCWIAIDTGFLLQYGTYILFAQNNKSSLTPNAAAEQQQKLWTFPRINASFGAHRRALLCSHRMYMWFFCFASRSATTHQLTCLLIEILQCLN